MPTVTYKNGQHWVIWVIMSVVETGQFNAFLINYARVGQPDAETTICSWIELRLDWLCRSYAPA